MIDTLINCDCMDFMKTLPDNSVDLTLTDIPYDEVNKTGTERSIQNLNKGAADILTFNINSFLKEVDRITKGTVIIFCGITQVSEIFGYFKNKGYPTRQLIWEKTNPSPMNGQFMYLSATENAVWSKRGGAFFNASCESNVFHFPLGSSTIHPTEKNHDLLRKLIVENSKYEQLIFDPCAGSGSTLLIAGQEGRHYLGCELDTEFYRIASNRLKTQGGFQTKLFEEV